MKCSDCGQPIEVDHLRCGHCGHDMLPEDIARKPLPEPTRVEALESEFLTGLIRAKRELATSTPARPSPRPLSRQDVAQLAAADQEMKRNRWRLLPILVAAILTTLLAFFTAR